MAKHNKPSSVQSWMSYVLIFLFAASLGTVGSILQYQGGNVPGITDSKPPVNPTGPPTPPPIAIQAPKNTPENSGTANKPQLNLNLAGQKSSLAPKPVPAPAKTTAPTTTAKPPPPAKPSAPFRPNATSTKTTVAVSASTSNTFDLIAQCESTNNWSINTGNGYYGGLQISITTWIAYGGLFFALRPDLATEQQQKAIAVKIQAGQGWGAWPSCSAKLGLL